MGRDDRERVQDAAEDRQHDRAESVEDLLATVREDLGTHRYPVTSEALSAYYADRPLDAPNETEALATAFDRIDASFEDAEEAYEALVTEFERGEHLGIRSDSIADEAPYWDEDRAATREPEEPDSLDDRAGGETPAESRRRASEAQAAEAEGEGDAADDAAEDENGEDASDRE